MPNSPDEFKASRDRFRLSRLLAVCFLCAWGAAFARSAEFGRLTGTVRDTQGDPLMGVTVFVVGPVPTALLTSEAVAERVITDAQGRFTVEHLVPGRYSLRVVFPARLPSVRNLVRVEPGQTTDEKFVLTDVFTSLRFRAPSSRVTSWGDNWKWVLRSAAATRPILRYEESAPPLTTQARDSRPTLPASRLIGIIPGSSRRDALAGDPGLGSVLAYLRPLSDDSDVLVAGSMNASGLQGSSLATSFRRHIVRGDMQELTLVVHQLSFMGDPSLARRDGPAGFNQAQGIVVNYARTRRLSDAVTFTGGMEIDYLNAPRDVAVARPRMKLEYKVSPATVFSIAYGEFALDDPSGTLLERIGILNAFPRVTLRNYRPRFEQLSHTELSFRHRGKRSQLEIAAYRDNFQNATVAGHGHSAAPVWLAGAVLPNSYADGLTVNAGDYRSSGLRAAYSLSLGPHVEAGAIYAVGQALRANTAPLASQDVGAQVPPNVFRPWRSHSVGGSVCARLPGSKTQIVTSYQWLQRDRVTGVDPYGYANLELAPFLGVQIRQPLPTLALLPAHIDALADFRNLLGQGYVPVSRSGTNPFTVASAYRSIRGGFSVQF